MKIEVVAKEGSIQVVYSNLEETGPLKVGIYSLLILTSLIGNLQDTGFFECIQDGTNIGVTAQVFKDHIDKLLKSATTKYDLSEKDKEYLIKKITRLSGLDEKFVEFTKKMKEDLLSGK